MATTSTNKQPVLLDRPLHNLITLTNQNTGNADYWLNNNNCALLVDCTQNDGALLEDIYAIARGTVKIGISLFLGSASDILRESDPSVTYVGKVSLEEGGSAPTAGKVYHFEDMPFQLAPLPVVPLAEANSREAGQARGFFVPKGKALWCGLAQGSGGTTFTLNEGPVIAASGGFY